MVEQYFSEFLKLKVLIYRMKLLTTLRCKFLLEYNMCSQAGNCKVVSVLYHLGLLVSAN